MALLFSSSGIERSAGARRASPKAPARNATIGALASSTAGESSSIPILDLALPDGFRELPELSDEVRQRSSEVAGDLEVTVQAWADPSIGCFLLAQQLRSPGSPFGELGPLLPDLASDKGIELSLLSSAKATSRFTFVHDGFHGSGLIRSPGHSRAIVESVSCFYTQRHPHRSAKLCEQILEQVPGPGKVVTE